jgi:hypothetical protein
MVRITKVLLTILLGAVAAIAMWTWSPWVRVRYRGDATFADQGFGSYPRYSLTSADIPLYTIGEYHFHFKGAPHERMGLRLYVRDRKVNTMAERVPLENLPVTIEAVLADDAGHVTCKVSGRPSPSNEAGVWVLMSGGGAAYWQYGCNEVQIDPHRGYDLTVQVINVEAGIERVVVAPILTGGGVELP